MSGQGLATTGQSGSGARQIARHVYRYLPLKQPIFEGLRHFPVPEALYQHLHFDGIFRLDIGGGASLRWRSYGDIVENRLFWDGLDGHERSSVSVWRSLAKTTDGSIYDIGANSGLFACLASIDNPSVSVVAFEPLTRVARRLRENVELNNLDVMVVEAAVSDRNGSAEIHDNADPRSDGNSYSASLETVFDFNTVAYAVQTIAIDQWKDAPQGRVGLIKLDVECHEPAAVRGMVGMIGRDRPAMLVEVLSTEIGDAVTAQLDGHGYLYFQIDESRGLIRTDRLAPLGGTDRNCLVCTSEQFDRAGLSVVDGAAIRTGTNA